MTVSVEACKCASKPALFLGMDDISKRFGVPLVDVRVIVNDFACSLQGDDRRLMRVVLLRLFARV